MPENKKPVKQVSVYNGTDWDTHDIGANAENITLSSIGVGDNVQTAFTELIGLNSLGTRQAVITDSEGRITTGNISASSLEGLDDMVITDDAGAPTEDVDFTSGDTTLTPASTASVSLLTSSDSWSSRLNKISLMFRNIRYLIGKLGNVDLTGIGDGTVTSAIKTLSETFVVEKGTSGIWTYRKWSDGVAECWGATDVPSRTYAANGGYYNVTENLPSGLFNASPTVVVANGRIFGDVQTNIGFTSPSSSSAIQTYLINRGSSAITQTGAVYWIVKGRWK